jgi:hypothetical protein
MEAGLPVTVSGTVESWRTRLVQRLTVTGLILAFKRFRRVTLLVTGDLQVPQAVIAPLWHVVDEVLIRPEDAAMTKKFAGPRSLLRTVDVRELPPVLPGVTAVGPSEVVRGSPARRVVRTLARSMLGRYYPAIRQRLNPLVVRVIRPG